MKNYLIMALFVLSACYKPPIDSLETMSNESPEGYYLGQQKSTDLAGKETTLFYAYLIDADSSNFHSFVFDSKSGKYHKVSLSGHVSKRLANSVELSFDTYVDECGVDPAWRPHYGNFSAKANSLYRGQKSVATRTDKQTYNDFLISLDDRQSISCSSGCESWNTLCIP